MNLGKIVIDVCCIVYDYSSDYTMSLYGFVPTYFPGSFLLSDFDDENVLAMKVDPKDSYLVAGDTAGVIAIFNIKDYCSSTQPPVSVLCCHCQSLK